MESNQKPEWFEIAENDQPASRPLKKKSAPMRNLTFILAGILVIPMGAGFALLTHEDHSAVAAETLNLTQDSPVATNSATAEQNNTIAMPTTSRDEDDDEGDDDYDYRAPVFSNTSSVSPSALAPIAAVAATKAPAAITPPAASASNDIILPPIKKGGDDDDDDDHKKSNGKKSKDSDDDDEEDDD
jgi:hypothetical protein